MPSDSILLAADVAVYFCTEQDFDEAGLGPSHSEVSYLNDAFYRYGQEVTQLAGLIGYCPAYRR